MTKNEEKSRVNPAVAGVVGAAAGATIAAAVTAVLSDKKKQQKIKEVLTDAKNNALEFSDKLKKQAEEGQKEVTKKITEAHKAGIEEAKQH